MHNVLTVKSNWKIIVMSVSIKISIIFVIIEQLYCPLCPRLVHALLPAYRRQRLALMAAGISTDITEQEELDHLVQRERGVVWADQEKTEEKAKPDECTETNCLQPILSFSHLITHQNTPCSEWREVASFHCALQTAGNCRPITV